MVALVYLVKCLTVNERNRVRVPKSPKIIDTKSCVIQDIAQCAKEGGSIYAIEVRVFYDSAASAGRL